MAPIDRVGPADAEKPLAVPAIDAELEWQALRLQKIVHKKFEVWAISRIIHGLDDPEIEWATQQLVPDPAKGRIALLDLYFPQFRYAIEIDELGHIGQIPADRLRERRVIDDANVRFWRWEMKHINTLDDARRRIDELIEELRELKRQQVDAGTFVPFRFGRTYDVNQWIARGGIGIRDDARFRRHTDVGRLFGKNLRGHYSGMMRLSKGVQVWFPKLYPNVDWFNALLDDGNLIVQRPQAEMTLASMPAPLPPGTGSGDTRLVFAHYRDEFGQIYYRFVGAFIHTGQVGDSADFRRIGTGLTFDGAGGFEITSS
ncbi:MAG: nucleotidyltransferase/DNA polymerase [Microbacterium sp.]|jgi:hypothetical protein|nr:nucleotidyltransferase/DNA polymerase [Microbacterium sp.]